MTHYYFTFVILQLSDSNIIHDVFLQSKLSGLHPNSDQISPTSGGKTLQRPFLKDLGQEELGQEKSVPDEQLREMIDRILSDLLGNSSTELGTFSKKLPSRVSEDLKKMNTSSNDIPQVEIPSYPESIDGERIIWIEATEFICFNKIKVNLKMDSILLQFYPAVSETQSRSKRHSESRFSIIVSVSAIYGTLSRSTTFI